MTLYSHQDVLQAILIQVSHQQTQETRHIIFIILNKQLLRMNTWSDTSVILLLQVQHTHEWGCIGITAVTLQWQLLGSMNMYSEKGVISLHMTCKSTNNKQASKLKVLCSMQILVEEVV